MNKLQELLENESHSNEEIKKNLVIDAAANVVLYKGVPISADSIQELFGIVAGVNITPDHSSVEIVDVTNGKITFYAEDTTLNVHDEAVKHLLNVNGLEEGQNTAPFGVSADELRLLFKAELKPLDQLAVDYPNWLEIRSFSNVVSEEVETAINKMYAEAMDAEEIAQTEENPGVELHSCDTCNCEKASETEEQKTEESLPNEQQ